MPASKTDYFAESTRGSRAVEHLEDLKSELRTVKEDLGRLRRDIGAVAARGIDVVKGGADDTVDRTRKAARSARHYYDEACDYATEHPVSSMLVAIGVGALVVRLMKRR